MKKNKPGRDETYDIGMNDACEKIFKMWAEIGPTPRLSKEIRMSQLTFDHILADQGEINEANITPWQRLAGTPVIIDEEMRYGWAKIIYNDGTEEEHPIRVMIRVRV